LLLDESKLEREIEIFNERINRGYFDHKDNEIDKYINIKQDSDKLINRLYIVNEKNDNDNIKNENYNKIIFQNFINKNFKICYLNLNKIYKNKNLNLNKINKLLIQNVNIFNNLYINIKKNLIIRDLLLLSNKLNINTVIKSELIFLYKKDILYLIQNKIYLLSQLNLFLRKNNNNNKINKKQIYILIKQY
jgi:hypothetical protein